MREKGRNMPTIPVMPAAMRWLVSENGGMREVQKTLTESDEAAEQPGSHTRKVILDGVRRGWGWCSLLHTLDWKVKTVSPRKTPKVINLLDDVRVPYCDSGGEEIMTYKACMTIVLSKYAHNIPRVKASSSVKVDRRTRLSGCACRFQ